MLIQSINLTGHKKVHVAHTTLDFPESMSHHSDLALEIQGFF